MENKTENIKSLILSIRDKVGRPVSNRVVVATIESLGIRNKDTRHDFGMGSISELADFVYEELTTSAEHLNVKNQKEIQALSKEPTTAYLSDYLAIKTKLFLQYYPKGILHLAPVALQIGAIIIFGYSLWTFVGFNQVQSTAVVLGVIFGLVATAGFVQVIGRQASFYWNHEDYLMVRQTIIYMVKAGLFFMIAMMLVVSLINLFMPFYPFSVLLVVFAYALAIGMLLLVLAPLHTINRRYVISVAVFAGTAVAVLLKNLTVMNVYLTHWLGISLAIAIAALFMYRYFQKKLQNQKSQALPLKPEVLIYHNYRYFFYGLLLYVFIFTDRIIAWSSAKQGPLPYIIYFEKDYELGMDLAIIVFLLLAGVLEYSIASFTKFIDLGQKGTRFNDPAAFNTQLRKMYWQHILLLFTTAVLVFVFIYFIITASWGYKGQFDEDLLQSSIMVCAVGGVGYVLLAWGMLNTLYLFTLGQAQKPLRALIYAWVTNLFVGLILSRALGHEYAVVGMLCGAIVFMYLTVKANLNYFNNLDYYYYAAY
jgi:hypothetical protein